MWAAGLTLTLAAWLKACESLLSKWRRFYGDLLNGDRCVAKEDIRRYGFVADGRDDVVRTRPWIHTGIRRGGSSEDLYSLVVIDVRIVEKKEDTYVIGQCGIMAVFKF